MHAHADTKFHKPCKCMPQSSIIYVYYLPLKSNLWDCWSQETLCAQKEALCIVCQISGVSWLCIDCLGDPDPQLSFLICNLKSRQRLAGGEYRTQLTAFSPHILMLMHFCNCIISMAKITIGLLGILSLWHVYTIDPTLHWIRFL